jgi:CubicO group peptidase (beta-lactamase class C family)
MSVTWRPAFGKKIPRGENDPMTRAQAALLALALIGFRLPGAAAAGPRTDSLLEELRKAHVQSLVIAGPDVLYGKYAVSAEGPDSRQPVYSVTKTILALLVGIAQHDHALPANLSSPLVLSGEKLPPIRQLLTMTAGYDWHEWNDWGNASRKMKAHDNWTRFFSSRPRLAPAGGTAFAYDSGSAHIMAAVLADAVGDLEKYLGARLFAPLGISDYSWQRSPEGVPYGGSGLLMRPADLIKIGQLFLQKGRWQGKQVVPASWIAAMTRRQVPAAKVKAFFASEPKSENKIDDCGYGYFVWVRRNYYFAMGYGGQLLVVLPGANITIAMTGTAFQDSFGALARVDDIMACK